MYTFMIYDQFPHFPLCFLPLLISNSSELEQRNGSGCKDTFQHTHTLAHIISPHICQHPGIIQMHLTRPKRACCVLEHTYTLLLSTNHHSLISCGITGRQSAPLTSCTAVGKPPPVTSGWEFQLASLM